MQDNGLPWSSDHGYIDVDGRAEPEPPSYGPRELPRVATELLARFRGMAGRGLIGSSSWEHWHRTGHALAFGCCRDGATSPSPDPEVF